MGISLKLNYISMVIGAIVSIVSVSNISSQSSLIDAIQISIFAVIGCMIVCTSLICLYIETGEK